LRLVQLNVWGGRLERQLLPFFEAEQPDIICLQEAISFEAEDSGFFATVENIQKVCQLPFVAMAPVFTFDYQNKDAHFGNCIISRYPIQKSEVLFTHLSHKKEFQFGRDSTNVRNFVHVVTEIEGKAVNFLTHHGYHVPDHKNGTTETLAQMQQLGSYIEELSGPVILTGDFNLAPHSESLEVINRLLTNLPVKHHLRTTRNSLTHKTEVCDYIFVNDAITVKNFLVSEEIVSDHKALLLDFDV
jgi:endonuclease/exonuclease/phosphatase family metal-dependent hydrolase